MIARKIKPDILSVGAIDWDRRLFDELVPLPEGTTYNSYLIQGSEKTALIDTVYPAKTPEFVETLKKTGLRKLDYIVSNHGEQDHSGSIPAVLALFPEARIVTNSRCKDIISEALPVPAERFLLVNDGDTLSLGNKTLQFLLTPWVHWPDTMVTYIAEDKVLFSCDFLGAHLATSDLYATDERRVYDAAKRYYAEIMMPFRSYIRKHLERLAALDIATIAPSHGPVYSRPAFILDLYASWASDEVKREVVIPHVSMYESTARMVDYLINRLVERDISVRPHNLVNVDTGELAKSLVEASTIVFASPTVLNGPHPAVVYGAYLTNILKPKACFAAVIGSFGWGTKISDRIQEMLPNLKTQVRFLDPVLVKGMPKEKDLAALDRLAEEIDQANRGAVKAAGMV